MDPVESIRKECLLLEIDFNRLCDSILYDQSESKLILGPVYSIDKESILFLPVIPRSLLELFKEISTLELNQIVLGDLDLSYLINIECLEIIIPETYYAMNLQIIDYGEVKKIEVTGITGKRFNTWGERVEEIIELDSQRLNSIVASNAERISTSNIILSDLPDFTRFPMLEEFSILAHINPHGFTRDVKFPVSISLQAGDMRLHSPKKDLFFSEFLGFIIAYRKKISSIILINIIIDFQSINRQNFPNLDSLNVSPCILSANDVINAAEIELIMDDMGLSIQGEVN